MATPPSSSRQSGGVGGKIVKNKRLRNNNKTPYSRPPPPSPSTVTTNNDPQNPNWLSGFIYPAKFLANNVLSFFSNNDFDDDDDDDDDSSSFENDDDDETENDMSFQEDDQLDKVMSPTTKSDNKRAIEQLVMQETFSRKEANEFIKLVRSRIVDAGGNIGETTPNMRTTAILEARKWLQEKRSGSKKQLENELDVSNVATSSQILKSEKGSPVDMARSYMQSRPAWASPSSLKKFEAGYSSPLGMLHFKDVTPKSTLCSSELKKSSFTSGSWNLLDEIRRVRSRATEELLAATPLTKTIPSLFSAESNQPQQTLMNNRVAEGSGLAVSTHDRSESMQDAAVNAPSRDKDAGRSLELQDSDEAAGFKYNNNEVKQLKSTTAENGFGSASGVAKGQDTNETRQSEEENGNLVDLSQGGNDIDMENLKPQEEPAVDIPTEVLVNGSQNSSSMQEEDLSQDFSQPVAKDDAPAKAKDAQYERKLRGNTRKVRGRGK